MTFRKRIACLCLALATLSLMMLAAGSTNALAAVELKLSHFASDTHPCGIAAMQFKANVEKRTGGEAKIAIFGNNALGNPPEVLKKNLVHLSDREWGFRHDL